MLAFVNGMYKLTLGSGQPGNVMVLAEGSTDESFSNVRIADAGDIELQPGILRDDQDARWPAARPTWSSISPCRFASPAGRRAASRRSAASKTPSSLGRVHGLTLHAAGSGSAAKASAPSAPVKRRFKPCIGEGIARELGRDRKPEQLAKPPKTQSDSKWVRHFPSAAALGSSSASSAPPARRSTPKSGPNAISSPACSARRPTPRSSSALPAPPKPKKLKDYLNNEYEKAAVQAYTETEYFANLSQTNWQFLISIIIVTAIMSLGGIFGVMNTMFAAVSQRSKDIGVLRILGFSRLHVQASFLLESLVLALAGGVAGSRHRLARSRHESRQRRRQRSRRRQVRRPGNGRQRRHHRRGTALSLAMGLFGGLIPSIRAMLIRPLESLR